jgi:GH18 family chitinase
MQPLRVLLLLFSLSLSHAAAAAALSNLIVDQFGWRSSSAKVAILAAPQSGTGSPSSFTPGASFEVRRVSDNGLVFTGTPSVWNGGATHSQSGDKGWWADFSGLSTPGRYVLSLPGGSAPGAQSYPFSIDDAAYQGVLQAAVKFYYYQRCGTAIDAAHGGAWVHATCHSQEAAADLYDGSDQGQPLDIRGGWHDAGDYRKYTSFMFSTMWFLMKAYEWNPCAFGDATGIPESGNGVPDILDEVKWELDWLLKMQVAGGANAGALYSGAFVVASGSNGGTGDPSTENTVYYHANISSGATSTGCMAFAMAARLFQAYGTAYPGYAATLQSAALAAWTWLQAHPANVTYNQANFNNASANIAADEDFRCRVTAAAELFRTTGGAAYQAYFDANYNSPSGSANGGSYHPILNNQFWAAAAESLELGLVEYADTPGATASVVSAIKTALKNGCDNNLVNPMASSDLYRGYMWDGYYGWGSNGGKGIWGSLGVWASHLGVGTAAQQAVYRADAEEYLHYFHGRNPLNWVYLTNLGPAGANLGASQSVDSMFHSWFFAGTTYDGLAGGHIGPAPGYLTGGPNQTFAPDSSYNTTGTAACCIMPPQGQPMMKAYKNWGASWPEDSWEVTEPDLGYQAPYVFLAAASVPCAGPQPSATPTFTPTNYAGTPTSTSTASPTPSATVTPTPVCATLLNGAETIAENGTWSGTNAVRSIVASGSAPAGAVTQGSNALYANITVTAGWNDQIANLSGFSPSSWTGYTQLRMDVYAASSLVAGSTYAGLLLRADCATCGAGLWYQPISADQPGLVAGAQTLTWNLDFSQGTIPAGSPISRLTLVFNNNSTAPTGALYLDNLRLVGACAAATPTPTVTRTRTPSASPSATPSASASTTPSASPSLTPPAVASATASPSASPSFSASPSPTASPSGTPSPLPTLACPRRVTEFYAYWTRGSLPASAIPYGKVTHIAHAFIRPLADGSLEVPGTYLDSSLISQAHSNGVKVVTSVGGAGTSSGDGSEFWDAVVLSPTARAALVDNLYNFCLTNGYDGVDLDYEFPHNAATKAGLTAFVQALRAKFAASPAPAPGWEITGDLSWDNFYGQWWDVANLKASMDYFNLMVYDMYGNWASQSGHNAALFDSTLPGAPSNTNGDYGISYYVGRGVPAQQLQYGLAAYGYRYDTEDLYQSCGGVCSSALYMSYTSIAPLVGAGWTRSWDANAQSPYLREDAGARTISYDDPQSIQAKTTHALWVRGAGGVFLWELSQDLNGTDNPLLDAAWAAAQCGAVSPTNTPTISPTLSASPSATPTRTPSPTRTVTATASPSVTPSPSLTPGVPSLTASPTGTPSVSPSPTPTVSPSNTAVVPPGSSPTATPQPTALAGDGSLVIQALQGWPQPNPSRLSLQLSGPAERALLRVYTPAWVLVAKLETGALSAGWNQVSLAGLWAPDQAAGLYYVEVQALRGSVKSTPLNAKLYLLR